MNSRSEMRRIAVQKPDALIAEIERLRAENAQLRKTVGIACTEHDLTHAVACLRCYDRLKADWQEYDEEIHRCRGIVKATTEDLSVDLEIFVEERDGLREALEWIADLKVKTNAAGRMKRKALAALGRT